ncbi:MAG: amino acid adenylation domain-containing protein [Thermodesulfobacteriota bacterium]|nr:amino acid adenylation domain-containing protein [Thermodesulfobacteriota bacterium]
MKTIAIIQARLGSTRLPGKVLFEVAGRSMIGIMIERLRRSRTLDGIVLATGEGPVNNALEHSVAALGVPVFRGPEDDVLARYAGAAEAHGADVVVRLTGDCPLMDPEVVDLVVRTRAEGGYDYVTNVKPPTWPDGMDVSVFTREILDAAHAEARLASDREHVVPWMWRRSSLEGGTRLTAANVASDEDLSRFRWTVDEASDFEFLSALAGELGPEGIVRAGYRDILGLLEERPDIQDLNQGCVRDAGYAESLARDREADPGLGSAREKVHLVQDYVTLHAKERPDALMVCDANQSITYGEMDAYTNRLARFLADIGVRRGDKAAFYMAKSVESFRALFGILKADGVYVPLDFNSPPDRVRFILGDCGCEYILCDAGGLLKTLDLLQGYGKDVTVVALAPDADTEALSRIREEAAKAPKHVAVRVADGLERFEALSPACSNIDTDLAYIIYTSGSTGRPKGVMIAHKSIVDYAAWTVDFFQVTPEDRLSSHAELHFDLSVFDVYTAFRAGASLHPVPRTASMFPVKFLEFVEERALTLWCSVPSFLTYVGKSGVLKQGRIPSLRTVTFCGEVMPASTIIDWMGAYPHIRYVNQYGPTETTCASTYYEITKLPDNPAAPIPIGGPIPNTEVFAVREDGRRVRPGEAGELFIRGTGNSLGYWNNEERTKRAFVQHPLIADYPDIVYATGDQARLREDGLYDFVGRKDNQIKYMGYRIELGEIESVLASFSYVESAAVVGFDVGEIGGTVIAAFVCLKEDIAVARIRDDLSRKLSAHMVPKKIAVIEKMPFNANGKIDRLRLKEMCLDDEGKAC